MPTVCQLPALHSESGALGDGVRRDCHDSYDLHAAEGGVGCLPGRVGRRWRCGAEEVQVRLE